MIHITDNITFNKGRLLPERMALAGEIFLKVNGRTLYRSNQISGALLDYLASCMQTPFDGFIRSAELFTVSDEPVGGVQDAKDGLVYRVTQGESSSYYTFATEEIVASNARGKRWKGEAIYDPQESPSPSPSPSPEATLLDRLEIGRGYGAYSGRAFSTLFATRDETTEEDLAPENQLVFPYEIQPGDVLYIEWEIYFVPL